MIRMIRMIKARGRKTCYTESVSAGVFFFVNYGGSSVDCELVIKKSVKG